MIVIGIDPGTGPRGIRGHRGQEPETRAGLLWLHRVRQGPAASARLLHIYTEVAALLEKYPPAHIAVEKLFFSKNITSAMSVSEARGVILLLAEQQQIPVTEYTPNQVKQAITGSGRADKRQMQEMIKRLLHLRRSQNPMMRPMPFRLPYVISIS